MGLVSRISVDPYLELNFSTNGDRLIYREFREVLPLLTEKVLEVSDFLYLWSSTKYKPSYILF